MSVMASKIEALHYSGDKNGVSTYNSVDVAAKKEEEVSLRVLEVGQHAQIVHVHASGELGRRIREMGLIPGAEILVVGRAPLKDPVALRLLGFTLTLRNNEADYITVKVIE